MDRYNDILEKIVDIIKTSETLRKNSKQKNFDRENFVLIKHFPIYKNYV